MEAHGAGGTPKARGVAALFGDTGDPHTGPMIGRIAAAVRKHRPGYWLVASPVHATIPRLDHFGPHNAVEWVIWVAAIVVVGFIAWRVIDRRLPPD